MQLTEAIEMYLVTLRAMSRSPETVLSYKRHLGHLQTFCTACANTRWTCGNDEYSIRRTAIQSRGKGASLITLSPPTYGP
jgi:site-specific recombinase XerC